MRLVIYWNLCHQKKRKNETRRKELCSNLRVFLLVRINAYRNCIFLYEFQVLTRYLSDQNHIRPEHSVCAAQFDVGKITLGNSHPFRQLPARHSYGLPCLLHVRLKIFKTGTVFYIRHIISPSYILLFIGCAGNDLICTLLSFYNSNFLHQSIFLQLAFLFF